MPDREAQVRAELRSEVRSGVRSKHRAGVRSKLRSGVRSRVRSGVRSSFLLQGSLKSLCGTPGKEGRTFTF